MSQPSHSGRAAHYTWPLFRAALASGKTLSLPVNGRCMWPALKPKDLVLVRRLEHGQVCPGDILVCVHGQRAVVHRVATLGLNREGEPVVRCRGDASPRLDAEVRVRDVCGVVVGVERASQRIPLGRRRGLASVIFCKLQSALGILRAAHRPLDLVRTRSLHYRSRDDRSVDPIGQSAVE